MLSTLVLGSQAKAVRPSAIKEGHTCRVTA